MKLLIDSSVLIDFLRQKNKPKTWLTILVKQGHQLYASIITHTELYAGKSIWEKKIARIELEKMFSGILILPLEESISQKAGQIKAKYNINLLDTIIAATAIMAKLPLVTLNVKDFKKIKELKLYIPTFHVGS